MGYWRSGIPGHCRVSARATDGTARGNRGLVTCAYQPHSLVSVELTATACPQRYRLALGVLPLEGLSDLLRSVQGERRRDAIVRLEKDVQGMSKAQAVQQRFRLTCLQKALEDAATRKATAADRMRERYKELEEAKQSRKIVVVDKLTVPTKGKAARGRQGGMVFARAGQPRRKSTQRLLRYVPYADLPFSPDFNYCSRAQRHLWQSES